MAVKKQNKSSVYMYEHTMTVTDGFTHFLVSMSFNLIFSVKMDIAYGVL